MLKMYKFAWQVTDELTSVPHKQPSHARAMGVRVTPAYASRSFSTYFP